MAVATMQHEAGPQYPAIKPGMMGMYIFLASEVMFFGSLFATYFYLFGSHIVWPPPAPSTTTPRPTSSASTCRRPATGRSSSARGRCS